MCHDVEEVFWGYKVSDSQKVQEAFSFRKRKEFWKYPERIFPVKRNVHVQVTYWISWISI